MRLCWALSSRLRINHLVFILYGLGLASFITVLVFAAHVARNLIVVKMPKMELFSFHLACINATSLVFRASFPLTNGKARGRGCE